MFVTYLTPLSAIHLAISFLDRTNLLIGSLRDVFLCTSVFPPCIAVNTSNSTCRPLFSLAP